MQECNNDDMPNAPPRPCSLLIVLSPKHSIMPSISLLSLVHLLCILFFLLLLRPPSLLFLPPLLHSLVVLFCTQSLLDHSITNRFKFIVFGLLIIVCRNPKLSKTHPKLSTTLAQRFVMENHPLYFSSFVVIVSRCPKSR